MGQIYRLNLPPSLHLLDEEGSAIPERITHLCSHFKNFAFLTETGRIVTSDEHDTEAGASLVKDMTVVNPGDFIYETLQGTIGERACQIIERFPDRGTQSLQATKDANGPSHDVQLGEVNEDSKRVISTIAMSTRYLCTLTEEGELWIRSLWHEARSVPWIWRQVSCPFSELMFSLTNPA